MPLVFYYEPSNARFMLSPSSSLFQVPQTHPPTLYGQAVFCFSPPISYRIGFFLRYSHSLFCRDSPPPRPFVHGPTFFEIPPLFPLYGEMSQARKHLPFFAYFFLFRISSSFAQIFLSKSLVLLDITSRSAFRYPPSPGSRRDKWVLLLRSPKPFKLPTLLYVEPSRAF